MHMVEAIRIALAYLVEFTRLPDEQIFKICIEFWNSFSKKILQKSNPSK